MTGDTTQLGSGETASGGGGNDGYYTDKLYKAALEYASQGIHVIPCMGKEPTIKNGLLNASSEKCQIHWWFSDPNTINKLNPSLALLTGRPSDLVVIDCDVKHGKDGINRFLRLCKEHDMLPSEVCVSTPGGGRHFYYRYPAQYSDVIRTTVGLLGPGIDSRADGGYIMVPPSRVKTDDGVLRCYRFERGELRLRPPLPQWIVRMLRPISAKWGRFDNTVDFETSSCPDILRRASLHLQNARPGGRNNALYGISLNLGRYAGMGFTNHEDAYCALYPSAQKIGLQDAEIERTFTSGFNRGLRLGRFSRDEYIPSYLKAPAVEVPDSSHPDEEQNPSLGELPPPPLHFWPEKLAMLVEHVAAARGVTQEMVVVFFLGLGSACTGWSRVLELRPDWHEPALLWLLLAADSGSGKSHTMAYLFKYLNLYEGHLKSEYKKRRRAYEEELIQYKKNKRYDKAECPRRPKNVQFTVDDPTLEAMAELYEDNQSRGLAMVKDEALSVFENMDQYKARGSSKARLLSMYDGAPWKMSRKNQEGMSREIYLARAPLSFCGSIQTQLLPRFFAAEDMSSGLAQRFLLVHSQAIAPMVFDVPQMPAEMDELLRTITHGMLEFKMIPSKIDGLEDPYIVRLDKAAEEEYRDFFDRTSAAAFYAGGDESGYLSKLTRNAARLSLVLYALDQASRGKPACEHLPFAVMEAGIKTAQWMDMHRRRLSPFSQLKGAMHPADRILARCVVQHADEVRALGYKVPVKLLCEWLNADKKPSDPRISEDLTGKSASRMNMPSYRTGKGRMRVINEEIIKKCVGMTEILNISE